MASLRPRLFGLRARVRTIDSGNLTVRSLGIAVAPSINTSTPSRALLSGSLRLASTAHAYATKMEQPDQDEKTSNENSKDLKRTIDSRSRNSETTKSTGDTLAHPQAPRKNESETSFPSEPQSEEELVIIAANRVIAELQEAQPTGDQPSTERHCIFSTASIEAIFVGLSLGTQSYLTSTTGAKQRRTVPPQLALSLTLLSALQRVRHPRTREMYTTLIESCLECRRPNLAAEVYVGLVEEWIMEGRVAEGGTVEEHREGGGPRELDDPFERRRVRKLSLKKNGLEQIQGGVEFERARMEEKGLRKGIASVASSTNGWFQGVRTWKFPGERISPGEALDLWHPKNLAIHEKMRGFPMPIPTSPPSLVPEPPAELLHMIVMSLDVTKPGATDDVKLFKRYGTALAVLANTVLSRTLPITALPPLIRAFDRFPATPPVFPKVNATVISLSDRGDPGSPYTAQAHVRRALFSLIISPPSRMSMEAKGSRYRLPPLLLSSTHSLIQHAMRTFRDFRLLRPLMDVAETGLRNARARVSTLNLLIRNSTLIRRNDIAEKAIGKLFGGAGMTTTTPMVSTVENWPLADDAVPNPPRSSSETREELEVLREPVIENDQYPYDLEGTTMREAAQHMPADLPPTMSEAVMSIERVTTNTAIVGDVTAASETIDTVASAISSRQGLTPDVYSLTAVLSHYTATSQFDKAQVLIYKAIPFLNVDHPAFSMPPLASPDELLRVRARRRVAARRAMRMPMMVWSVMINTLCKAGKTTLAERVFHLAKRAEKVSWGKLKADTTARQDSTRKGWMLPIHVYTNMMDLYADEYKGASRHRQLQIAIGGTLPPKPQSPSHDEATATIDDEAWAGKARIPRRQRLKLAHDQIEGIYGLVVQGTQRGSWRYIRRGGSSRLQVCVDDLPRPDARFFNAYIRHLAFTWRLPVGGPSHILLKTAEGHLGRLSRLQDDMSRWRVPIPAGLIERAATLKAEIVHWDLQIRQHGPDAPSADAGLPGTNTQVRARYLAEVRFDRGEGRRGKDFSKRPSPPTLAWEEDMV